MTGQLAAQVTLPTGALVAVGVIALIQLALVVYCIIDIVRRPVVLGDRKWLWIVLILLFNLVGSVVYLAVGRVSAPRAAETRDEPEAMTRDRAASAADLLYGAPHQPDDDAGEAGSR